MNLSGAVSLHTGPDSQTAVTFIRNIFCLFGYQQCCHVTLRNVREEIENNHQSYFDKASDLAARIGSEISAPRRCGRQRHRGNVPATTATNITAER